MYYLPISKQKAQEILKIARVTKEVREDEEKVNLKDFFDKLEKIHIQGIPDIGEALFQSINRLEPKEKIAFKLIIESGRGTVSGLSENSVQEYIKITPPPPSYEISDMLSFIELPKYIDHGMANLNKWLK